MEKVKIQGTCFCGCNIRICLLVWSCLSIIGSIFYIARGVIGMAHLKDPIAVSVTGYSFNGGQLHTTVKEIFLPADLMRYMYAELILSVILSFLNIVTMGLLFHSVFTDNASNCRIWTKVEITRIILAFCGVVLYSVFMMIKFGGMAFQIAITVWFIGIGMLIPVYVVTLVRKFASEVEASKVTAMARYSNQP